MDKNELVTAAYMKAEPPQPDPVQTVRESSQTSIFSSISGSIVLLGALLMIFGNFGVLLIESDLFQIAHPNGQVTPSPFSEIASTTNELWVLYAGAMLVFVLGAICVGSQPATPMVTVVYVLSPVAAASWALGWPLRQQTPLREWLAAIYFGVGIAISLAGWYAIQSQMEHANNDRIIFYSLVLQGGLALLAGGALAWWMEFFRSRREKQQS